MQRFNFKERTRQVRRVLWITLLLNLLVAAAKLLYGHISESLSMVADGFHSALDGSSNVIGLVALVFAAKPADKEHPYGHRKVEAIAAMLISGLLFYACYEIVSSAVTRYRSNLVPEVTVYSFLIMLGTIAINTWVSRYEHRRGHELQSQILTADSAHTRSDIFASLSVIVALIAVKLNWGFVDLFAAGAISLLVGYSGYRIIVESFQTLMDSAQLDPREVARIAMKVEGVAKCHNVRTRGHPTAVYMDLNIHVDPNLPTQEAHRLTHRVIDAIKKENPQVVDVVVHTEPETKDHP
jgi:cation diffusion facilitator family transporter